MLLHIEDNLEKRNSPPLCKIVIGIDGSNHNNVDFNMLDLKWYVELTMWSTKTKPSKLWHARMVKISHKKENKGICKDGSIIYLKCIVSESM